MSAPAGDNGPSAQSGLNHSNMSSSGGFAGLVHKMVKNKPQSNDDSTESVRPSKGLPSTGLKRNTKEWQDEHGKKSDRNGKQRSDSVSSSSSIPSDVNDDRSSIGESDQEGALGRGKGKHEKQLWYDDDGREIAQSPTNEDGPNGHDGDDAPKRPPPANRDDEDSLLPGAGSSNKRGAVRDGGHGLKEDLDDLDEQKKANGQGKLQGAAGRSTHDDDPEQKVISRQDERMRKFTDESGRYPDGLKAVKGEEPPGPRLDIVLDPRISHINVSSFAPVYVHRQ